MKKLLAALSAALMMMALFGAAGAQAAQPEDKGPGPNGSNEKGLCTAYFNGQKKGHDKDGTEGTDKARPFQELERDAEDSGENEEAETPGETSIASDVLEFCNEAGVIIGGQPEHNGRFDCYDDGSSAPRDTDDSDGDGITGDGELECLPNTNGDDGTGGANEKRRGKP